LSNSLWHFQTQRRSGAETQSNKTKKIFGLLAYFFPLRLSAWASLRWFPMKNEKWEMKYEK
jgi:hypothetical protein